MQVKTAILIGAGARGARAYAPYALENPHELKIIAVAEPNDMRREKFQEEHKISSAHSVSSWRGLLKLGKIADFAIICTQDTDHFKPTMLALELGYDVLL